MAVDLSLPIDVQWLDSIVDSFSTCTSLKRKQDHISLEQLLQDLVINDNMLNQIKHIWENTKSPYTRLFVKQVLKCAINERWKCLPVNKRTDMLDYIVLLIEQVSTNESFLQAERWLMHHLNALLVQILVKIWPSSWQSFIPYHIATTTNSRVNFLNILKLLSAESYNAPSGKPRLELKQSLYCDFHHHLCQFFLDILSNPGSSKECIRATLSTLCEYLPWVPVDYVLESPSKSELLDILLDHFSEPSYHSLILQCLIKFANIQCSNLVYAPLYKKVYNGVIEFLQIHFPASVNILKTYRTAKYPTKEDPNREGREDEKAIIQNCTWFLVKFLERHLSMLEHRGSNYYSWSLGMDYLMRVCDADSELFKVCMDCLISFILKLFDEDHYGREVMLQRQQLYSPKFPELRRFMINHMFKPVEILMAENGYVNLEDDVLAQHKNMSSAVFRLSILDDHADTKFQIRTRLSNNLSSICWLMGSVSGFMDEPKHNRFLKDMISSLLSLGEKMEKRDGAACGIMYAVGQYPRFLRTHSNIVIRFVNLLFNFVDKTPPVVKNMACDTLFKVVQEFKDGFNQPYISELLSKDQITGLTTHHQIETFFRAVCLMIEVLDDPQMKNEYMARVTKSMRKSFRNCGAC